MTTTIYKYYDVDNGRMFFDWAPDRPVGEYYGQYSMVLPGTCKVYKKDCFTFIEHGGELFDLLTDKDARPFIQVGKYKKIHFDIVEG